MRYFNASAIPHNVFSHVFSHVLIRKIGGEDARGVDKLLFECGIWFLMNRPNVWKDKTVGLSQGISR